jgi:NAD(P)-dependent dehydrogenase (short-subunit alcohol dehydrogenase family)
VDLTGAAAFVSGGASGLGEATARAAAEAGAIVAIADLDEERGPSVAADVGGLFVKVDVADEQAVSRAVDFTVSKTDLPLRIAVSCAGIGHAGRIVNRAGQAHSLDIFQRVLQVNLVGTFNVMRFAAAAMMKCDPVGPDDERGLLVNTASVAALEGQTGQVAYAAAKGGVVAMTLPAARDLAIVGIRVCTIVPGTMDTPLFGRASAELKESLAKDVLFPRRMGTPAEFGDLVVALARNSYLNAEVIRLDGGLRMPPK